LLLTNSVLCIAALHRGSTFLYNALVFKKVQNLLGGRVRVMLSGSAPLSRETQIFMQTCFRCPLRQVGATSTIGTKQYTWITISARQCDLMPLVRKVIVQDVCFCQKDGVEGYKLSMTPQTGLQPYGDDRSGHHLPPRRHRRGRRASAHLSSHRAQGLERGWLPGQRRRQPRHRHGPRRGAHRRARGVSGLLHLPKHARPRTGGDWNRS